MTFEKENNDHFLLAQIGSGREEAFDFIFRKYYKGLTIQAIRIVRDQSTAESLVQDCFVRYWEKRLELATIEDLYSYLHFTVRNRCIDHLRKQRRIQRVPLGEQSDFSENVVEEKIDADDLTVHLWREIARLPERSRVAFEYSRIDGLTYPQIACKMGISEKAVEALISRGLRILRANLIDFLVLMVLVALR